MTDQPRLRVLSLGAGVQSTTLALMAAHGEIGPMPDCAVFADTEGEPGAVYEHLRWLTSANVLPYPVYSVGNGNLWKSASTLRRTKDGKKTYLKTGIPVFTLEDKTQGRGNRQCTSDFKIDPINRQLRELLAVKRVKRGSPILAEVLIGISTDEADRMKMSPHRWIRNRWPLVEKGMSRRDCLEWMAARNYPVPPRSACTFCPFHDDNFWLDMDRTEFEDVCAKERELQAAYAASTDLRSVPYFHRSCVPLSAVKFVRRRDKPEQRAMGFGNDCEGMCGV
jgi:hypothetical protein